MTIDGKGPYQIAKILTDEKVERPSYYLAQHGMGNHLSNYNAEEPYLWRGSTISLMLKKQEYMGHTVNFRTYKQSYKDKRPRKNKEEDWKVFKNTQEKIIDEETWNTVQKLRKTTRRKDTLGQANPLTGLLYCADCGAKMYNHRGSAGYARNWNGELTGEMRPQRDEYNCSNYDLARQDFRIPPCTQHYIRTEVVNKLILETIQEVSQYARFNEDEFIDKVYATSKEQQKETVKILKHKTLKEKKRAEELNRLIKKIYEDNVNGKLSDKRFELMLRDFEEEQVFLEQSIEQAHATLNELDEETVKADKFIALVKKYTDFNELTTPMLNEFVDKILVHEGKKENYERSQEIEIHLNFIGKFEMPQKILSKQELELLAEQQKKREKKREYNIRYMEKRREKFQAEKQVTE